MRFYAPLLLVLLAACTKYTAHRSQYRFESADGRPKYNNLDYWAAHPWKRDPSDSVPKPLRDEWRDSAVDVFFLHPTTYTKQKRYIGANARIDDPYFNAKTDYSTILYQASVFNQQARVFAPRYRQAHITNFFIKDEEAAGRAFQMAYDDVKQAFFYYLEHWNQGRPFIIAAHSQGSYLGERLLKEFFDGDAREATILRNKLVVAYIIGWPVPKNYFSTIGMCKDSNQTGCICSWRTMKNGFVPFYLKKENGNSFVTNPLTWTTDETYAPRSLHKGSILTNFNQLYPHTTDAQASNGLLYVRKPKFPGSFFYFSRNYHIGDINLFYVNIRENVSRRIAMYWKR